MKRAVLVHGWYGHPSDGWWPWLKLELEQLDYTVLMPQMPNANYPLMNEWVSMLTTTVGKLDGETYFVGHSLGCMTIMRYLESLGGSTAKAAGTVFVAGFTKDLHYVGYDGSLANFFDKPLDWSAVRTHCAKFWSISSDDDPKVSSDNHYRLVKELGAYESWEHHKKHMAGDDGVYQLDSVLKAVKNLSE